MRGWGSSPAARRGARQRGGLTHALASNTLQASGRQADKKIRLTEITVSTAILGHKRSPSLFHEHRKLV
jgi:hypothetical protein